MSGTSNTAGTSLIANSPSSVSSTRNSIATPIIIGASVAAVALLLSLFFLVFYFIRRRRSEYLYYNEKTEFSLYPTYKEDTLPPEPTPPPPPFKDTNGEKDLESGMKPLLPPKDFGRPFVKSKRVVEGINPAQKASINTDELQPPTFPARTYSKNEGGMF